MLSFNSLYNTDEDTLTGFIGIFIGCVEMLKGFVAIVIIDSAPDGIVAGFYWAGFYWNRLPLGLLTGGLSPKEGILTYYFGFYYFF